MKKYIKIFAALATIATAVYLVATYGDKIVAWAKKAMELCPCCKKDAEPEEETESEETPVVEAPAEEAPAEEVPAKETPVVEESAVVADEADFEK